MAIYYAPFDALNRSAKVVLVGITPGPTQARNALEDVHHQLRQGASVERALCEAKRTAAFSGDTFRTNLIAQLDDWGVHNWLGISSCSELFVSSHELVQSTSLLRYPVFVGRQKYEGKTPSMLRHPLLASYLRDYFIAEVEALHDAIFLGLGPSVSSVLNELVRRGLVPTHRVYAGLFHGSGENTYRIKYAVGSRSSPAPWRTSVEAYDRGKAAFQAQMLRNSLSKAG
ncbi:MAG: hypothetical protein U1F58_09065 [Burkholderiales bacterium]